MNTMNPKAKAIVDKYYPHFVNFLEEMSLLSIEDRMDILNINLFGGTISYHKNCPSLNLNKK